MNEDFLRGIYDSKNLGANGATFEDFLKDMQDVDFARKIFDSKELGAQGATFDDFITDSGLKPANPVQEHGGLYNLVGKIPVIGGAIQKGVDAISRGLNQGASLSEGVNALTEGQGLDDEEVQAVSKILQQNKTEAEGDNSITAKFMRGESLSLGEWVGLGAETVVQSGAMMLRGAFDALTNAKSAAMLGTGTAAGAAAGTPLFGIGALAGGVAGTMGTVSGLTEAAGMYFQELQKELDVRKLPINAENVRTIISDEEWLSETRKRASVKGIVVGGVDAITGGLAAKIGGKIVPKLAKSGLEGKVARGLVAREVGKGLGVEIAGGAGGEGLSQVALGDEIDVKSIALEGIGEILPGGISIYSGYIGSEGGKQIAEAKKIRTAADKTNTPITSEVKTNSERTSGIGHLVDAYKANDLEGAKIALADLAVVHTPEEFGGMMQVMAQVEGISAEDVALMTSKFEETYAAVQKFNTPELKQDPERTSRAVKTRLDITQAEQAEAQLEEQKSAADPSLHPKYDSQIEEVRKVKTDLEETLTAVVSGKQLEVSDDPVFYKTRLEELETTNASVRNESSAKTNELLEIGAVLQDNISSAILETYGSDETTTSTPSQKVLYDGVEYDVTTVNKNGSFDLSSRDGKFVKGAEKTDTEWQGLAGEQTAATVPTDEQKLDDLKNKRIATFTYKSDAEVPNVFKDRITSRSTINGETTIRVSMPQSEADYLLNPTTSTPTSKREKKPSAVTRLEKALAGIKGSPIAQIEQIGALLNIGSIPDFIYAKLGDGDILAGKDVIQKAKDVHAEVKAFQSKLAGGKFFSDLERQIRETSSRIETLDKKTAAKLTEGERLDQQMADIESRIETARNSGQDTKELQTQFNTLERQAETAERNTVFNSPLSDVPSVVDALVEKEKTKPNGFGSFIDPRDAAETKEVAVKYQNPSQISDQELKSDFGKALMANPSTWYADGLRLRESAKEASNRNITIDELLAEVEKEYTKAGYDEATAKGVIANFLQPLLSKQSSQVEPDTNTVNEPVSDVVNDGVSDGVTGFKTGKGSTYVVNKDGTTVRNKGHADTGVKPQSEKTVYVTKEQADALAVVQTEGWDARGETPVIAHLDNGDVAVGILGGKNNGTHIGKTKVTPSTTPAVGLYPLETWNEGRGHHFGNVITEVTTDAVNTSIPANLASPLSNISSFETSKGSVYTVLPDGRTQRFKTATGQRDEPQDLTVFVKPVEMQGDDILDAIQNPDSENTVYVADERGKVIRTNEEARGKRVKLFIVNKETGRTVESIETTTTPTLGYNTFDTRQFKKDGETFTQRHLGNEVTKITERSNLVDGITVGEVMAGEELPTVDKIYDILESEEGRHGGIFVGDEPDAKFETEEEAKQYAQEVYDFLVSLGEDESIPVYRAVQSDEVDLDPYGIGESWSFSLQAAKQFAKNNLTGKVKIISGFVPSENVNWEEAVRAYHNFSEISDGDSEFELPIPSNRVIRGVQVSDFKNAKERSSNKEPSSNLAEETVIQEPLPAETTKKLEDLSKEVTMKASTASDLYLINRRIWGLNHEQAIEAAVIQDRLVAEMARREGISKPEMYSRLPFKKNATPLEGALYQELVNGFYSPIEKVLSETKADKMPAKKWIQVIGNKEEATWTGVTDWLNGQKEGSVSKVDIQKFMRENRIEIKEVVKGEDNMDWRQKRDRYIKDYGKVELEITTDDDGTYILWDGDRKVNSGISDIDLAKDIADDYAYRQHGVIAEKVSDTKYHNYQLEGEKSGYKEILVTLPNQGVRPIGKWEFYESRGYTKEEFENAPKEFQQKLFDEWKSETSLVIINKSKQFKSSHFDEPNILVHLRMNTRTDADGKKVLFIEELQSDWGQKGKKEGFTGDYDIRLDPKYDMYVAYDKNGQKIPLWYKGENVVALNTKELVIEALKESPSSPKTPAAPFAMETSSWVKLGLKTAMREAVRQGADSIAWTTGEQQNSRYDLSKVIDRITYYKRGDGYVIESFKDSLNIKSDFDISIDEIENIYGKEIASKVANNEFTKKKISITNEEKEKNELSGIDLKVGGKGMIGFYGDPKSNKLGIVGEVAKSLFKQTPNTTEIEIEPNVKQVEGDRQQVPISIPSNQHSITITDELRKEVNKGLPLFQRNAEEAARGAMAVQEDGVAVMYALTDPNVSTPVHELVHVFERYLTAEERNTVLAEAKHDKWTTETSEFFAKGFERYLLDGVAPTPELQSTFEKFKKWLTDIYLGIRNSVIDTPISVRMQNLYASFLTDEQFHSATAKPRVFSSPDRLRGKINQTELDSLRKTVELSDIPPGQTQHIDDMIQESYEKYVTENPIAEGGIYAREEKLMKDALNGLPMDSPMQLALANVINKLKQAYIRETQTLAIAKQQGDKKGVIRSISDGIDAIRDQLDNFTRALKKARSVAGRSLGIGSKVIDFNAFDEVNLRAELEERLRESGKALTEADTAFIKELSDNVNKEVQEIAALDIKDQQSSVKTKTIIAESQISQMKKAKMAKRTQSVLAAKANLDRILKGNIC